MSDDLLNEMNRTLGRLEGKMDSVADAQKDQGDRLVAVEGKVNNILGWATGAGAVGGGMIAYIKSKLGGA